MEFSRVEAAYAAKGGCRLVWDGKDEDDSDVVVLKVNELDQLSEILSNNSTGKVELEDGFSSIFVNSDFTKFDLREHKTLEASTIFLRKKVLEFKDIPYEEKSVKI